MTAIHPLARLFISEDDMRYLVNVPSTRDVGSYKTIAQSSYMETMKQNALRDYNSCRAHDGLFPVSRMPSGTTYTPIVD